MTQPRFGGTPVIKPRHQGVPITEAVAGQRPGRYPLPPAPYPKPPAFIGGLTEAFAGPYQAAVGGEEYAKIYEPYRQAARPTTPAGQLGYLAGQAAPYLGVPGGTAGGFVRRGATGALAGGVQGSLGYVPPGGSRQRQGMIGAVTGGALPVGMLGAKRMVADPLAAGARTMGRPLDVPPQLQGYDPTLGQITRDPTQWAVEKNLARMDVEGIPMRERFTQQNRQLIQQSREFAEARGVGEEAFKTAERAQRVAKAKDRLTQIPVSRAYANARTQIGSDLELEPIYAAPKWRTILDDFENSIPADVRRRVDSFFPDTEGMTGGRPFTPNEINKTIQLVNQHVDPKAPKAELAALGRIRKMLDAELRTFEEADIQVAAEAWKAARKLASNRFQARGGSNKGIIADLVNPELNTDKWINKYVINGETRDVEKLTKYFHGYRRGQEVLDNMTRQVDEHLYTKAVSKAEEEFKGTNYLAALKQIGETKGKLIFGDDGWASRQQFAEASSDLTTTPFGSAVGWSNTAPTLFGMMDAAGIGRWPVVGKIAQTWRRGARESAQAREVKGALERLPAGFDQAYQRWMERMAPASGPAIQAGRAGAVPLAIELQRQ